MDQILLSDDLTRAIEVWGAIISTVIALATVLQVGVTWAVSRSISKATRATESLESNRQIYLQWQDYNKLVVQNDEFRKTHRYLEDLTEPEQLTQVRYLIFFVLNVINTAWAAERAKRDQFSQSRSIVKDHLAILYGKKDLVLEILDGARGYSPDFIRDCKRAFKEIEKENS